MAVRIKDVARVAGVSTATASRVLAGRLVNPEMVAAVNAAVEQTGYRPNLIARRLRSKDNGTIGLIVADICNPFFTAVSKKVEEIAFAHDLRVILCNTDEDHEKEKMHLRMMQDERVAGVIIAPSLEGVEWVAQASFDVPLVLFDRAASLRRHDAVVLDNHSGCAMLVDHLFRQGKRRITALLGGSTTGIERLAGYSDAMVSLGLTPDAHVLPHGQNHPREMLATLLSRDEAPEAIIGSDGVILLELARASVAMGLRIPEDLVLAGFDNNPWTEVFGGGVTVVEQPVNEIGQVAMEMLLARRKDADAPVRKTVLSGRLVTR
ncbi:LacI family DNA-binding transcriptional regulator [Novosphingobium terrae]|uniref:LacI family DNA-binding transcriptional regulator n=1 Tax=Novosphingobium terrae TaxID=2726189 RepID=UPI001981963C|nr:LacI family DNA-binding transcriptional regulator [Novosphingobium terrae]